MRLAIVIFIVLLPLAALAEKSDRRYAIIPNTPPVRNNFQKCIDAKVCLQTSYATTRKSCDGSQMIVKYNRRVLIDEYGITEPENLQGLGITWLTHSQMLEFLTDNPAWANCGS